MIFVSVVTRLSSSLAAAGYQEAFAIPSPPHADPVVHVFFIQPTLRHSPSFTGVRKKSGNELQAP